MYSSGTSAKRSIALVEQAVLQLAQAVQALIFTTGLVFKCHFAKVLNEIVFIRLFKLIPPSVTILRHPFGIILDW